MKTLRKIDFHQLSKGLSDAVSDQLDYCDDTKKIKIAMPVYVQDFFEQYILRQVIGYVATKPLKFMGCEIVPNYNDTVVVFNELSPLHPEYKSCVASFKEPRES